MRAVVPGECAERIFDGSPGVRPVSQLLTVNMAATRCQSDDPMEGHVLSTQSWRESRSLAHSDVRCSAVGAIATTWVRRVGVHNPPC
jgi:hypothetical protein